MSTNGHDAIGRMLAESDAQRQAQRQMMMVLQGTLAQPAVTERANINICVIADDPQSPSGKVLLIALPTGVRWDVPLSVDALRHLHRMTTELVEEDAS